MTAAQRKLDRNRSLGQRPAVRSDINLLRPEREERGACAPDTPSRRLKEEFASLFRFDQNSTGSDILVLRQFMRQQGFPEIPEGRAIHTFATLLARYVLPRRAWPLFTGSDDDRVLARKFLRQWASAVLPRVTQGGSPKNQPKLHSQMIPEMAAFYSPVYLGLGV